MTINNDDTEGKISAHDAGSMLVATATELINEGHQIRIMNHPTQGVLIVVANYNFDGGKLSPIVANSEGGK